MYNEAQETVSSGTLWLVLGISGTAILLLIGVVGAFLRAYMKTIHDDVKTNTGECGKNKGRIELVEQKQEQDKQHLEQMTQVQIQSLSTEVKALTGQVSVMTKEVRGLIRILAEEGLKNKNDE